MTDTLTPVLTNNWDAERAWTLGSYEEHGGYAALDKAFAMAPDDVITAVGDRAVIDSESLTAVVREHRVGDSVDVTYLRDGAEQTTEVTFTEDTRS